MQPFGARSALDSRDRHDLLTAAQASAEDGTAVDGSPIYDNGASTTLRAVASQVCNVQPKFLTRGRPQGLARVDDHCVLDAIDVQSDSPHVLRQRARGWCCLWLRRWLRLSRNTWRRRGRHNCSTGPGLNDGLRCRSCLDTWPGGYRDATCNDCGGGDAEPSSRDEIAAGDHRSSVLFSWFGADWLGRLPAC
jgi:hypothetical protein